MAWAILDTAGRTSVGTIDLTDAGLSTVEVMININTHGTVSGTRVAGAAWGIGIAAEQATVVQQGSITGQSQDAVVTQNAARAFKNTTASAADDQCSSISNPSASMSYEGEDNGALTSPDGRQLSITNPFGATAHHFRTLLLDANDIADQHVGRVILTSGSTVDIAVTAPGFTPDIIIFLYNDRGATSVANDTSATLGIAVNGSGQYSMRWSDDDNRTTMRTACGLDTTGVMGIIPGGALWGVVHHIGVKSYDANGFTLEYLAGATSTTTRWVQYLALKLASGRQAALTRFTSGTSTGSQTLTGAGFTPDLAIAVMQNTTATNSFTDTEGYGIAVGLIDGSADQCSSWASEDNVGTSIAKSGFKSVAAWVLDPDGTNVAFEASSPTFNSDGLTWTVDVAAAAAHENFILWIGDSAAPAGPTTVQLDRRIVRGAGRGVMRGT